jgi:GH43 family beta-xylosidase
MVVNKLETSPTDDARVVIYNHHMFIVQATEVSPVENFWSEVTHSLCKLDHFKAVGHLAVQ